MCEHFGLPDAWFDVDAGLLARGPIDAGRSLLFQHEQGEAINERLHRLLFQLHYIEHSRLRRHHAHLKACALARGDGSDDRSAYVAVLIARLVSLYSAPGSA